MVSPNDKQWLVKWNSPFILSSDPCVGDVVPSDKVTLSQVHFLTIVLNPVG